VNREQPLESELWGSLTLRRKLGFGASGEVYLAFAPDLDREVALRIYPRTRMDNGALLRQGRILARIRHPNLVAVHGLEEHDGRIGLWMDYVRGLTLRERARRQGGLGPQEATLVALDICRALGAVHATGLVHRGVRARNVMREEGGRLLLMECDLAADIPGGQPSKDVIQFSDAILYCAPEVLHGGIGSAASDVYSLGVLLYFLVSGSHPIEGSTPSEVIAAHGTGRRTLLRDVRPELPASFVEIVERALSPRPEDRFSDTKELEPALARVLGRPETPPSVPPPAARPSGGGALRRFRPIVLGLALLAAIALACLLVLPHGRDVRVRQLTSNVEGNAIIDCAISPDGRLLAYVDRSGLYIQDVETGETNPLPGFEDPVPWGVQWSPDQKQLLVWCKSNDRWSSHLVSLLSGSREKICDERATLMPPDGRRYACLREDTIRVADLRGGGVARVVFPHRYAWDLVRRTMSPTGDRWLEEYADDLYSYGLRSWNREGTDPIEIVSGCRKRPPLRYGDALWDPSGRVVYFSQSATNALEIDLSWLRVNPRSGRVSAAPHRILTTRDGHFPTRLTSSSDGKRLVALQSILQEEIFVADLDGHRLTPESARRLTRSTGTDVPAAWTRDGRALVFASTRGGTSDIFLMELESGRITTLAASPDRDETSARLSPDGKWLFYFTQPRGHGAFRTPSDSLSLWVRPFTGGSPSRIRGLTGYSCFDCASGPHGRSVLGVAGAQAMTFYELDAEAGIGRKLAACERSPNENIDCALSPDGRRLALVDASFARKSIRIVDLEEGGVRDLRVNSDALLQTIDWSPDGTWLCVTGLLLPAWRNVVLRVNLDGHTEVMCDVRSAQQWITRPIFSPDGRRLAFGEMIADGNAWLIEGW
jgi:serine/threonine protein kinase